MKSLPYHLLEPGDRLKVGDSFIVVGEGNQAVREPIHESWAGQLVSQCPHGIYLRPLPKGKRP
jgi:hypothetical protein